MGSKKIILTKHAAERLLERKIAANELRRILNKGIRLGKEETGKTLCIYKERQGKYYTLVIDEDADQICIITAYESGKWQIEQYYKVKKHGKSKMQ